MELANDQPSEDAGADEMLARECLDRFSALAPLDQPALAANIPPLFDAERLSFWLCHVLMPANDAKGRHAWLRCESTRDRLQFCAERLLSAEGKGAGNAAPGQ